MAKIESSRAKIYETKATFVDEPTQHVESEGEKLIKKMVQKQLHTNLSLEEQLGQTKQFRSSTEIVPLSSYASGQSSLQEFQKTARKAARVEELKSCGLSPDEIDLVLDYDQGEEQFAYKYRKMEGSVLSSRLLGILAKIEEGRGCWVDSPSVSLPGSVSRHDRELGLCVKPDSIHTKLLKFALSCQPTLPDHRPAAHPINHLKRIADDLFCHLDQKTKKRKRKEREQLSEATVASRQDVASVWAEWTSKEPDVATTGMLLSCDDQWVEKTFVKPDAATTDLSSSCDIRQADKDLEKPNTATTGCMRQSDAEKNIEKSSDITTGLPSPCSVPQVGKTDFSTVGISSLNVQETEKVQNKFNTSTWDIRRAGTYLSKPNTSTTGVSLWDIRQTEEAPQKLAPAVARVYSCRPQVLYTVRDKKIVPVEKPAAPKKPDKTVVSLSGQTFVVPDLSQVSPLCSSGRLSRDEIIALPRFHNYQEGAPSKVLFVKNLAASIREEDLVGLFGQFEDSTKSHISYRLMCGKMRGQAFVTFPDLDVACKALKAVNGVILRGKPVIIQYGKGAG